MGDRSEDEDDGVGDRSWDGEGAVGEASLVEMPGREQSKLLSAEELSTTKYETAVQH